MRPLSAVLLVSLLLNAAGLIFAFSQRTGTPVVRAVSPALEQAKVAPTTAESWRELKTDDLPALISRLRAAGFPPEIVRAMVSAQVSEFFTARRRALEMKAVSPAFWKNAPANPASMAAMGQLNREEETMLRELLGESPSADSPYASENGGWVDFLTPEKATAIRRILDDFEGRRSAAYAQNNGLYDREKMQAVDRAQREAIEQSLTPQEWVEYKLRNSDTARTLRTDLTAFTPSEAEFRAIFALREKFDEQFSYNGIPPASQMRERDTAQKALNEQIKAQLTPDRAQEYEIKTDYSYRDTDRLVTRLGLPPGTTDAVAAVAKEFADRRGTVFRSATPEERTQKLAALQQEATARLVPILGSANAVSAYQQYGGQWLQNMIPRPRPPAPGGN